MHLKSLEWHGSPARWRVTDDASEPSEPKAEEDEEAALEATCHRRRDGRADHTAHRLRQAAGSQGGQSHGQGRRRSPGESRRRGKGRGSCGEGSGVAGAGDRSLRVRLPAHHDGDDPACHDQRREAGRDASADGSVRPGANLSECVISGRDGAECGHALHDDLARRDAGTLDPEPSGHEGTLLPVLDARWVDQRVPGAGQAYDRHEGAEDCHHRSGLDRDAASRCHRVQVPDRHGLDPRSHLQHRHAAGLQGSACAAGPGLCRTPVLVRQAFQARGWQGRCGHRHEHRRAGAGQRDGRRGVLQALRGAPEDQSAHGRGRADGRQARQDRHRPRAGISTRPSSNPRSPRESPLRPGRRRT